MVTFIQNVKDIDSDKRQALEQVVGTRLSANQQVVIKVIDIRDEPGPNSRNDALSNAAEIARSGRAAAELQGVSKEEVGEAIDEAIRNVRHFKRT